MPINQERFKQKLKEKGLKVTNQRLLVLEVLECHRDKHMTVEDIYDLVKEDYPEIGLATIYRTVHAPTRELCLQIAGDLADFAKYIDDLQVLPVYGGSSIESQIRALRKGVQIIVATPGRLIDLINRGVVQLHGVHTVVLDEAD